MLVDKNHTSFRAISVVKVFVLESLQYPLLGPQVLGSVELTDMTRIEMLARLLRSRQQDRRVRCWFQQFLDCELALVFLQLVQMLVKRKIQLGIISVC